MKYKLLGKSGLRASELCLGAMTFGQDWGTYLNSVPKEESKKIFDLFVDEDRNLINTANDYQNGTSEKYVIGEFIIASDREKKFVLATKYNSRSRIDQQPRRRDKQ
ncbi:MAG TPA: aldo/keto reductase [Nitrososphaeraceae archaeon]|jgi:aryl-alcohol dehydrogenase-like predicted oxidoreductase|nr:aldo/keto reductase [Nitrososphaeraceae archaeon]